MPTIHKVLINYRLNSYDSQADEFTFCFSDLTTQLSKLPASRRSLLKITASIFATSPFVIRLKILFQTLCSQRIEWDCLLEGEHLKQWNSFTTEFDTLNQVRVPLCYFSKGFSPVIKEIHRFSDASERVLYVRTVSHDGTVITRLIASKTRVSPVKKQSIPQLELLGALILTRLVNTVLIDCPQKMKVTCWVDSTSTLFWINNDRKWKQYVSRHVSEI